jgi:1-aminocyclopropane-1-carboxylate deaminase/D-cysteine desulfhydrase-like pyridoxal-dependent ACC family enzyme
LASAQGAWAAGLAARTEGLLLDPVFTAKALAELPRLLDQVGGPVVFWHTGGLPAALWRLAGAGEGGGRCSDR